MTSRKETIMCMARASAGRGFVYPRYSAAVRKFMNAVGRAYLYVIEGVNSVSILNQEALIDGLEKFYDKNHKLIIAFRHVAKEDAQVMMYALNRKIHRQIRKRNRHRDKTDKIIAHAQFIYGIDALNWAGKAAAWLFPRIGCVPVQNGSSNRNGLNILRNGMREGKFPIALAPEGQVTYHMYTCYPIASGVASLASWADDDKDVIILPVAIGYKHTDHPEQFIRSVVERWEHLSGIKLDTDRSTPILALLHKVFDITVSLLNEMYELHGETTLTPREQINAICEKALDLAEQLANVRAEGTILDRLFKVRYTGMDAIHPNWFNPFQIAPVKRSLADFDALKAHVYLRHSQVVDVLEYIHPEYITSPCSAGRACEFALNLLDVLNRIQGGNINSRFTPRNKKAIVSIGNAIHFSQSETRSSTKRNRLKAITNEVQSELQVVSTRLETIWETFVFTE